jgi:hypothetical protein
MSSGMCQFKRWPHRSSYRQESGSCMKHNHMQLSSGRLEVIPMTDARFDEEKINQSYKLLSKETEEDNEAMQLTGSTLLADCVSVTVENNKVCVEIPVKKIGKKCITVPANFPNGTAAEACISICKKLGVPTGAKVTVKIAGIEVASATFGLC